MGARILAMKTGAVTDRFSTLSGVASTIYGNPDLFREVQNQIYQGSPTSFLDTQRPSDVFRSLVGSDMAFDEVILAGLQSEYDKGGEFSDYIDIFQASNLTMEMARGISSALYSSLDSSSTYGISLLSHFSNALTQELASIPSSVVEDVAQAIRSSIVSDGRLGEDVETYIDLANNNPQTKISVPPPDDILRLENSVDLGLDYRGIPFTTGYLSPSQYYNEVPFPGYRGQFNIPSTARDSISQGYVGYPQGVSADVLSEFDPSLTGFNETSSGESSNLFQEIAPLEDQESVIYQISLIGNNLNKFVGFNPETDSSGDLIDLAQLPVSENFDRDGGNPTLSRTYSPTF